MADRARPIHAITAPIRNLAHRFAYVGLVVLAFGLMLLGKADTFVTERMRTHVTDGLAPILDAVSRPVETLADGVATVQEVMEFRQQNALLREQRARLMGWQTVARRLEAENARLRALLNFRPDPEASFIAARVIADTGGVFAHSLVLNAGHRDGVRKGQAVVTGEGLVGRIADVGRVSGRVLLITDLNSRIPVLVEPAGVRAILAGDNSEQPRLIHLPAGVGVGPGDRIVTSGHGGAFPPRLPVGVIASVSDEGIAIQPFVERQRLEYVRVVEFGLDGILQMPKQESTIETPEAAPAPGAAP